MQIRLRERYMRSGEKGNLFSWDTEMLRLTVFPVPSFTFENQDWWHEITGLTPELSQFNSRVGLKHFEGDIEYGKLILDVLPNRIDWLLLLKNLQIPQPIPDLDTLGKFDEIGVNFKNLMSKWFNFDSTPNFQRIAFGVVLNYPVPTKVDGYEMLAGFLSDVKINPKGTSDFLYQINKPRPSKTDIEGFNINRLTKWSVAGSVIIPLLPRPIRIDPVNEKFFSRLELDINTSVTYQNDIPKERGEEIFSELHELALEIARNGDIA